jgi:hypothetical protein
VRTDYFFGIQSFDSKKTHSWILGQFRDSHNARHKIHFCPNRLFICSLKRVILKIYARSAKFLCSPTCPDCNVVDSLAYCLLPPEKKVSACPEIKGSRQNSPVFSIIISGRNFAFEETFRGVIRVIREQELCHRRKNMFCFSQVRSAS